MVDSRLPLTRGTLLQFKNGFAYEILELIGRGANCLVYDSRYVDSIGAKHTVRIKELYPTYLPIARDDRGSLIENDCVRGKFETVKCKFKETYKRNAEIRNLLGLTNSTSNAQELFEENGTCYSICVFDEGFDYRKYKDESLHELLRHVKSLAEVIGKYHQNGYLHLDIKPENVFILPETPEHIMLFDFDSVVPISSITNGTTMINSYSDGFSAPEQVRGNIQRIGPWSDIYSIGALLAYKLFGKVPAASDLQIGKALALKNLEINDEIISPKLLKYLTVFLKKTLAISSYARWNSIELLLDCLDQMIPLADPKAMFLVDNFVYNEKHFIGRKTELERIHEILYSKQAVFLSGIGGIGKTEIAKRYAYSYRDSYNSIVFLTFDESLKSTLISNDLEIKNCEFNDESRSDECFEAKYHALKKIATNEDLLIIDNFDVDYDDDLEALLELKCKFIFTTREDYRDYNYEQIDIDCMSNPTDAFELFYAFNDMDYSECEQSSLEEMFNYVDHHTMMIILLSKYLRDSGESPSELFERFCQIEGTTNTGETRVKHRKDKKLRVQRVTAHLQSLFEFSKFTDTEIQIMRSLSLLGPIRIQIDAWIEMTGNCFSSVDVLHLVKRGWIEGNILDKECKISLHQIILDLIYNEQSPNTKNCFNAIDGYIGYLEKREKNAIARKSQRKIADVLLKRIKGNDWLLAKFYYTYCRAIKYNADLLKQAKQLCEQTKSRETNLVLAQIETLKLENLNLSKDLWELEEKQIGDEVTSLYGRVFRKELKIFRLIIDSIGIDLPKSADTLEMPMQSIFESYICSEDKNSFDEVEYRLLLKVADALCSMSNRICMENMIAEEGACLGFSLFYNDAKYILLFLEECIFRENDNISFAFKEQLLQKLIDFYNEDDFTRLAQVASVGNESKSAHYTEALNDLRKSVDADQDIYWLDGVSYMEAAVQEMLEYNYSFAIELYYKALKNEESLFDDIMYRICEAHICLQHYDDAEKGYLKILEYDSQYELDKSFTYQALAEMFKKKGDFSKATDYYKLIFEEKIEADEIEDAEWIIASSMILIDSNTLSAFKADEYMEIYLKHLVILDRKETIDDRIVDSLENLFVIKKEITKDDEQLVYLIYRIANRFRVQNDVEASKRVYRSLINHKDIKQNFLNVYLRCILWAADLFINYWDEDYVIAEQLLSEAHTILTNSMMDSSYCVEKQKMLVADLYKQGFDVSDDLKEYKDKSYNLLLITNTELDETGTTPDSKFQTWLEVAEEYISRKDNAGIEECLATLNQNLVYDISCYLFQKYIERTFSAIKVINPVSGFKIKMELNRCISNKLSSSTFTDDDIKEIAKCLFREFMKAELYSDGISIFIEWLYSAIHKEPISKTLLESIKLHVGKEFLIKEYLQYDLDPEIASEIVLELKFVVKQLEDNEIYSSLRCEFDTIKSFYEQTTVEFKY